MVVFDWYIDCVALEVQAGMEDGPSVVPYFNAYMYSDYHHASVGYQNRNNAGPFCCNPLIFARRDNP
jgi:hypothetical protein